MPEGFSQIEKHEPEQGFQDAAKRRVILCLKRLRIAEALKTINKLDLSDSVLKSLEIQEAARQALVLALQKNYLWDAVEIRNLFKLPKIKVQDLEKQAEIDRLESNRPKNKTKQNVLHRLKYYDINEAIEVIDTWKNTFEITDSILKSSEVQDFAKKALILSLQRDQFKTALKICDVLKLPEAEVQDAAKQALIFSLEQNCFELALKIRDTFKLPEAEVQDLATQAKIDVLTKEWAVRQETLKMKMIEILKEHYTISQAKHIRDEFNIPESIVQEVAKARIIQYLQECYIYWAIEIRDSLNIPESIIQEAAKAVMIQKIQEGRDDLANEIREKLKISEAVLQESEVQEVIKAELIKLLQKNDRTSDAMACVIKICNNFCVSNIILQKPEVQEVAKVELLRKLQRGNFHFVKEFNDKFELPETEVQNIAKQGLIFNLQNGGFELALKIIDRFKISNLVLKSAEVQDAAKRGLIFKLQLGQSKDIRGFYEKFEFSDLFLNSDEVLNAAKQGLIFNLQGGQINDAFKTRDNFKFSDLFLNSPEVQNANKQCLIFNLQNGGFDDVHKYCDKFSIHSGEDWQTFFEDETIPTNIRHESSAYADGVSPTARRARFTHYLAPDEYRDIEKDSVESLDLQNNSSDWPKVAEALVERMKQKNEDASIVDALKSCVNLFGAKNTLVYLNRPSMTRHDGLSFAPQLISLYKSSGLSAEAFAGNILLQVAKDDSNYPEGSAHSRLDQICRALAETSPQAIFQAALRYPNIEKLQTLIADFSKAGDAREAFASWKNLKKLYEINDLLKKGEILKKLNSGNISPRLRRFVQTTAFHPGVDGGAVIKFMEKPAEFLAVGDEHDSLNIHKDKKPSNYVSLPYLGLSAENLRDAYVEGKIDRLQTLPPMERTYVLSDEGSETRKVFTPAELADNLRLALGSRSENISGQAQDFKKLFSEIRKFCSKYSIDLAKLVSVDEGEKILSAVLPEVRLVLANLIFRGEENRFGMARPGVRPETYRVRIGEKSDPEMVVAGNDTACCMPFGSGKNNVYTFNPNCSQLIVERKTADGWKTMAQSVVSLDLDTGKPTPEIIEAYTSRQSSLKDLLTSDVFLTPSIVTCDNIEIAKNEEGRRSKAIIECYRRFFTAYLGVHAEKKGWDATKVAVGTGYTPNLPGLDKVPNTVIPFAPMGYSDNIHAERFEIKSGLSKTKSAQLKTGILPMETADTLAVAWLEGKAFAANESLLYNLHHMQNNIIGQAIAGQFFDRPNLSFVSRSDQGTPIGYLLAYEGISDETPIIFVSDIAVDPGTQGKGAGGQLMQRFVKEFAENYGTEKKPFLPVFANLRESTSYPILKKNLANLASANGLMAEMVEVEKREQGGENFYDVFLVFGKTKADIERQKGVVAGMGGNV